MLKIKILVFLTAYEIILCRKIKDMPHLYQWAFKHPSIEDAAESVVKKAFLPSDLCRTETFWETMEALGLRTEAFLTKWLWD